MLSNSQPFPATYKWSLPEADTSVWTVTPQSGTLSGESAEEVTVRWAPKPTAPHGESQVTFCHLLPACQYLHVTSHDVEVTHRIVLVEKYNFDSVSGWPAKTCDHLLHLLR